jgi:eukaryotic-like serine/threonine-protein kinase
MSEHKRARWFLVGIHFLLLSCFLAGCGFSGPSSASDTSTGKVVLSKCQTAFPSSAVSAHGSVATQQILYVAASNSLYALNASDGTGRWCQQLTVITKPNCPPGASCPPDLGMLFGTPKIANRVAYVCGFGDTNRLYAFNTGNGALLWQTPTDCGLPDPAFLSYAVPFVQNGIVYDGPYAFRASDGTVLWRLPIDPQADGGLQIQAVEGTTIYGNTVDMVYALDAPNGKMLWHYKAVQPISGPLVVDGQRLFVGTSGSSDDPQASRFSALNADTGSLLWQYQMGNYNGAVVSNGAVYVSSRDQHLYAFQEDNGRMLWKHAFASATYLMPTSVGNVLYINVGDGAYALRSRDGTVLWHRNLPSDPEVDFTPSIVSNGITYLAAVNINRASDGSEQSTLYALDASSGVIYWQRTYPFRANPFTIA